MRSVEHNKYPGEEKIVNNVFLMNNSIFKLPYICYKSKNIMKAAKKIISQLFLCSN